MKHNSKWNYIPQNQRKKILLLSDDCRMHSGVATMSRELMLNTAHYINWVQLGAAVNHPDQGKIFDLAQDTNQRAGIDDASMKLYPSSGYGNQQILRELIEVEKPDAIMHFTDPRYWRWLYEMSDEIRSKIPIIYYTIWDNLPYPFYNKPFYESCDALYCISMQTKNIVEQVLGVEETTKRQVKYLPHGISHESFFPIDRTSTKFKEFAGKILKGTSYSDTDFIVFHNNRNIRRKQTPDVLLAFNKMISMMDPKQASRCIMLLHTQPIDENGTNLIEVAKLINPDMRVIFSQEPLDDEHMNMLYNMADVTVNIGSNEGWGLSSTESMVAGTFIINNVTGGLQDQCGIRDMKTGKLIELSKDIPSLHDLHSKMKIHIKHGEWCTPVWPSNRSLQGSLPTPYIFDDRVDFNDLSDALNAAYELGRESLKESGLAGREFAMNHGMTASTMSDSFLDYTTELFANWTPIARYKVIKYTPADEYVDTGILN